MEITLKGALKKTSFLQRCWDGIMNSSQVGEAQFCVYCGDEKKVFLNPLADEFIKNQAHVELVDCECEQRFKMLKEFLEINYEWLNYPGKVPTLVPDYGGCENKDERRMQQKEFVMRAKREYDGMFEKRERIKFENRIVT